ncbi:MAG: hypothetical protein PHU53_08025 [Thermoplasmata archaeon]|nr:hypothetical protein [Thermoplasmata archaeon]
MTDRNWIILYLIVGIFFGLSTGAGLAMDQGDGFNAMKFMLILAGMILLMVLMVLNWKVGRIIRKL